MLDSAVLVGGVTVLSVVFTTGVGWGTLRRQIREGFQRNKEEHAAMMALIEKANGIVRDHADRISKAEGGISVISTACPAVRKNEQD